MFNSQSNCTPKSRTLSAGTMVSLPTTMVVSDDDNDLSAVDEAYHKRSVLLAFNCRLRAPHHSTILAIQFQLFVRATAHVRLRTSAKTATSIREVAVSSQVAGWTAVGGL